jgi:hypothetical protein
MNTLGATIPLTQAQEELVIHLVETLQQRYQGLKLTSLEESPEESGRIWITVQVATDEEEEIALQHYAAELTTELLIYAGCSIGLMIENTAVPATD